MHGSMSWPVVLLAIGATSCQAEELGDARDEKGRVSYDFDGEPMPVDQATVLAYLDETKQLLGPNTHLLFIAGSRSGATHEIGRVLQINLPIGLMPGTHPVRYKPMPGKSEVWVSYYDPTTGEKWVAHSGTVTVQSIEPVGGCLRLRFGELHLSNTCGEEHVLENGEVDVRIGSEDGWAQSEFYVPPGEPDEYAAELENNVVIELDDRVFACPRASLSLYESQGENPITMLSVIAPCACRDPGFTERLRSFIGVIADLPLSDTDAQLGQDLLFVDVDVEQTPDDLDDDELWIGLRTPEFTFHSGGATLGAAIDISAKGPLPMAHFVDGDDPYIDISRIKTLNHARFYGFLGTE